MLFEAHESEEEFPQHLALADGGKIRARARSLDFLPTTKLRRRLSKLRNFESCEIFTINEHGPTTPRKPVKSAEVKEPELAAVPVKSGKRRSRTASAKLKAPDITHFPLLLATQEELIAATKRKPSRAKSAPLQVKVKAVTEDRAKEHLKDEEEEEGSTKTRFKKGSNLFM